MSIIHLQRRKLPMDAHLAPLILSNAPKLLTSKHFQRITKGKQELYERLFDFSPLRRSLSLSLTNKSETKKWIYGVYVKLFQFQSFELFLKNTPLIFTVTFKYLQKGDKKKKLGTVQILCPFFFIKMIPFIFSQGKQS